jgi:hypothetical protein
MDFGRLRCKNEGDDFLWNVGNHLQDYTASQLIRLQSKVSLPWTPQIYIIMVGNKLGNVLSFATSLKDHCVTTEKIQQILKTLYNAAWTEPFIQIDHTNLLLLIFKVPFSWQGRRSLERLYTKKDFFLRLRGLNMFQCLFWNDGAWTVW